VHKSIRLKLFIAFLLTTLLVVAGMYVFMRWSLERGFSEFIEARQQQRIELLIDRLGNHYAESASWEPLASSRQQWIQMLRAERVHRRQPKPWRHEKGLAGSHYIWPPALPGQARKQGFTPLNLRLMLLNVDKSIIYGRQQDLSQLSLHPIQYEQKIVGYLGLLPGKPIKQLGELRFMEQQTRAFIWIALLMVFLSAGLALLLAYFFGRRLKKITVATKALGSGRYSMRLPVESSDELGQLAQDFNEMASALEQAEQARQRWIADVSHELRTPLAILRGELEALQDGIRPMTLEAIDSLSNEVMRLTRLTDDLYQLALSDHGALTYRKIKLDPIIILKRSIAGLRSNIDKKQLSIQLIDKTHSVILNADPDRLAQLFQNLLTNSINYTDRNGYLEITLFQKNDILMIDLNDSEPGVSTQELDKLFDRLYRVEKSRSRNLGGAGLGLAICSNIVAAHGGTIKAGTSGLGGLAVHIELPIQS